MPKLLVVDKSVFHTLHHCDEKLSAFSTNYNVVLPFSLAVECNISEDKHGKEPDKLLTGVVKAIKSGAKMGYESAELLNTEKTSLCPVKSVIDEKTTQQLRNTTLEISKHLIKEAARRCINLTQKKIDELVPVAETLCENICKNENIRQEVSKPIDAEDRFKDWAQNVNNNDFLKNVVETLFGQHISSVVDTNWFTWQYARLWFMYFWDWSYKNLCPGSSVKNDISNDFYDIEYVLYLLKADGLLTNDQRLQIPLAKAAFPEKDVFVVNTSLNASRTVQNVSDDIDREVTVSYRSVNDKRK